MPSKCAIDMDMYIDHINISAPRELLDEVKDFYCDVLGLKNGFRQNFPRFGYWLYGGDNALIHLIESDSHVRNEKQGYLDHFAFRATGLAPMLESLNSHQIDYRMSFIEEKNLTQVFLKDPSGTGVEIGFVDETV